MWYASTFNTCLLLRSCSRIGDTLLSLFNKCPLTVALSVPSPLLHHFSTQPGPNTPATPNWRPRTAYARGCGAEAAARVGAWASLGCTQCKAAGDWPSSEGKWTYSLSSGGWGCALVSWVKDLCVAHRCWTAWTPTEVESPQRLQQEVCGVDYVHFLQSLRLPKKWQPSHFAHILPMHLARTFRAAVIQCFGIWLFYQIFQWIIKPSDKARFSLMKSCPPAEPTINVSTPIHTRCGTVVFLKHPRSKKSACYRCQKTCFSFLGCMACDKSTLFHTKKQISPCQTWALNLI